MAVFALPNTHEYATKVCRAIAEYSGFRVEQLGGDQHLLELHRQGGLDRQTAIEFSLMRQLQRDRPQEGRLSEKSLAFRRETPQLSSYEIPTDFFLDRYELELFDNNGLAVYPAQHIVFGDGEPTVILHKSVKGVEPYLVVQLHDRSGIEEMLSICPDHAHKTNPLYMNIVSTFSFLDVLVRSRSDARTVVFPYFAFSRSDRPDKREAVNASLFLRLLAEAGADDGIFIDLHAGQVRGMVDPKAMTTDNLYLRPSLLEYFVQNIMVDKEKEVVVVAPDPAAGKLAQRWANALKAMMALGYKIRNYDMTDTISRSYLLGDVRDKIVLIVDDEVASGSTNENMIDLCHENQAASIYVAVSHAKLFGEAAERFTRLHKQGILSGLISGNTIPHSKGFLETNRDWLHLIDTSRIVGQAIYHNYCGLSLSSMYVNH